MKTENVVYRYGDGTSITMIRLRADDGKALTLDGESFYGSIDVESVDGWREVPDPVPPEDEPTVEDKAEAYDILMGVKQ